MKPELVDWHEMTVQARGRASWFCLYLLGTEKYVP